MNRVDLRKARLTEIYESSISRFGTELGLIPDPYNPTDAFVLDMTEDLKDVKQKKKTVKPPFFTYRMSDVSENDDTGMPAERLSRLGVLHGGPKSRLDNTGKVIDPNLNWKSLHPLPVTLNFNVEYICTPRQQVLFSQLWMFAAIRPITFRLIYDDIPIPIHIRLDRNVTYSDVDFDTNNLVACATNASMNTYIVKEATVKPISRYTATEKIIGRTDESDPSVKDGERRRVSTNATFEISDGSKRRTL